MTGSEAVRAARLEDRLHDADWHQHRDAWRALWTGDQPRAPERVEPIDGPDPLWLVILSWSGPVIAGLLTMVVVIVGAWLWLQR